MLIRKLIIFLFILTSTLLSGQSTNRKVLKNDISVNITSILGNALSLTDEDAGSPYGVSYRRINGTKAVRISINGFYDKTNQVDQNFNIVNSSVYEVDFRIGYEKILNLSSKTNLMYGLDLLTAIRNERSEINAFNLGFSIIQEDKSLKYGLGPALRFEYKINDRVSFMTESTLYFTLGNAKTEVNDPNVPNTESDLSSLELSMPQAIFITIAF
jgi:hypothetical protein